MEPTQGGLHRTGRHIDPAEEARHREVMHGLGVYDATWSLSGEAGTEIGEGGASPLP
jgi:hypothetical protein